MARMLSDTDRAQALAAMLNSSAYPSGDERPDEQRDINRRIPAKVGSDSRRVLDQEDIEDAQGDEDSDVNPPDQFAPVMPPRQMRPAEDALPGNEMSQGEDMVPVPRSMVNSVMAAMMQQASGNAIGRSMGADGQYPRTNIDPVLVPHMDRGSGEVQDYLDEDGSGMSNKARMIQEMKDNRDPKSNSYNNRRRGPQRNG